MQRQHRFDTISRTPLRAKRDRNVPISSDSPTSSTVDQSATPSAELTASIPWIMRNGVGIQVMETIAVGAFLTSFAVVLGASNFVIGLLAATPHLSQLAQLPALVVVDRYRDRKKVYFWSGFIARPMLLLIGAAAFVPNPSAALSIIVVAFLIRYMMGAFLGCAWGSWMRDLVPDRM